MQLVDDDVVEVAEQHGDLVAVPDEERLDRLGGRYADPRRVLQEEPFAAVGDVAVAKVDGEIRPAAHAEQAGVLVVEQGLGRGKGQDLDARSGARVLEQVGQDRQDGCLALAARGGGRDEDVTVGADEDRDGPGLGVMQALPAGVVHPSLQVRMEQAEGVFTGTRDL